MNYTWTITDLQTVDKEATPDYVVFAKVLIEAQEDGYTAEYESYVHFEVNEGSDFAPYESLTNDQVVEWIQSTLGEPWIKIAYRDLTNKINMQRNPPVPPVSKPLPWE